MASLIEGTKCGGCSKNISERYPDEKVYFCTGCDEPCHTGCIKENGSDDYEYSSEGEWAYCKSCVRKHNCKNCDGQRVVYDENNKPKLCPVCSN